jgi:SAM-dependent methyltransferase
VSHPAGIELTFTAHNVALADGRETLRGTTLTEETDRCRMALAVLMKHVPPARARAARVADLGCLEGGYAVAFARAGYDVTGVEARAENFARCQYVAGHVNLGPRLEFARSDVMTWAARQGKDHWDAVYCGGLLYHMEHPVNFLRQYLWPITRRLLIVESHFALDPQDLDDEGYRGTWHIEDLRHPWAAWKNERSFWLSRDELVRAMRDAGFSRVEEVSSAGDRGMFTGLKS